jgi:enterochelin esterase-like enzyme
LPAAAQIDVAGTRVVYSIKSSHLGETRDIFVVPPNDDPNDQSRSAVLVLLDADDAFQFAAAVANIAFLTNRGEIPPFTIVGVPNGKSESRTQHDPAAESTHAARVADGRRCGSNVPLHHR